MQAHSEESDSSTVECADSDLRMRETISQHFPSDYRRAARTTCNSATVDPAKTAAWSLVFGGDSGGLLCWRQMTQQAREV